MSNQETLNDILLSPELDNEAEVMDFIEKLANYQDGKVSVICDGQGGDLNYLTLILFFKKQYNVAFDTIIISESYSANSILFLLGENRFMSSHASYHLHDIQISAKFSAHDNNFLKATKEVHKVISKILSRVNKKLPIYIKNGKENYFLAKKCKKMKICTEIFELL